MTYHIISQCPVKKPDTLVFSRAFYNVNTTHAVSIPGHRGFNENH